MEKDEGEKKGRRGKEGRGQRESQYTYMVGSKDDLSYQRCRSTCR